MNNEQTYFCVQLLIVSFFNLRQVDNKHCSYGRTKRLFRPILMVDIEDFMFHTYGCSIVLLSVLIVTACVYTARFMMPLLAREIGQDMLYS